MGVNQTTSVAADHYPVMIDIDLTDISYEDYELTDPDAVTKGAGTSVRVPYRQREE